MASEFEKQLDSTSKAGRNPKLLPLTHVTSWAGFIAITAAGHFQPKKPCPVYGTHLVYSFYGRPAYRLDDTVQHNVQTYAPVCFLLKSKLINDAIRMLPFDSGGFPKYSAAMHYVLQLADYELSVKPSASKKLIRRFWSTNRKYFETQPVLGLSMDPTKVALLHYYSLISHKLSLEIDNRCSTIEVQFPAPLPLDGAVEAIIVPSNVANARAKQIAKSIKAELLIYDFDMPYYVNDFSSAVRQVVRGYLKEEKYFG